MLVAHNKFIENLNQEKQEKIKQRILGLIEEYNSSKEVEFLECEDCIAKPGTPTLCVSCLLNRDIIESLKQDLNDIIKVVELYFNET